MRALRAVSGTWGRRQACLLLFDAVRARFVLTPHVIRRAELKVCDFGVSKVLGSKGERLSDIAGSPMYIAPEVS